MNNTNNIHRKEQRFCFEYYHYFNKYHGGNPYHGFQMQYDDVKEEYWARDDLLLFNHLYEKRLTCYSLSGLKSKIRAYRRRVPEMKKPYNPQRRSAYRKSVRDYNKLVADSNPTLTKV
jgi:hypothetical protein